MARTGAGCFNLFGRMSRFSAHSKCSSVLLVVINTEVVGAGVTI